ncbi:MAG: neutral zinc metallopeptidase [Gemmatimonadaceae bacterium]
MRWTAGGRSSNIEDRRGEGGGGIRLGGAGLGIGGTLILLVLSLIFGRDFISGTDATVPSTTTTANGEVAPAAGAVRSTPEEDKLVEFVSFVLDDAQGTWAQVLPKQAGTPYREAKLVLFRDAVRSGCGVAESAAGPFYCPTDQKVYIDLGFYDELRQRFGASGDFAQAYVITHELGHHVQRLLGTEQRVRELQERRPQLANDLSVRLELQADCYAGVWGNSTDQRRLLESGDVEEALNAAASIGDDRIQRQTTGSIRPESFTHGSSAQRVSWFKRGFTSGRMDACDTFAGAI